MAVITLRFDGDGSARYAATAASVSALFQQAARRN